MARAVRITRTVPGRARSEPGTHDVGYRPNVPGLTRSGRLFGLFLAGLGGSYAIFLGLLLGAPASTGPTMVQTLAFLTAFAVLIVVVGFALTLGRTPRGVESADRRLVVIEFLGRRRVFLLDGSFRRTVENRYPSGWLGPEPTEMLALHSARGPVRHYLVGEDLVPDPGG